MIGHSPLVAIRMARKRPKSVWVWVGMPKDDWAATWHLYSDLYGHPWITIEPKDRIEHLDLRFLVGLPVHIDGDDTTDRVYRVHTACLKAGAAWVYTFHQGELIVDKGEPDAIH
jgi:hypothetical protein